MTDRQSAPLTPTETQTLDLLATGLRPYEIAQHLGLNTATIRITAYTSGSNRANVVDATTGKRPRSVLANRLHPSGTTTAGATRRTGYRLVTDTPAEAP